MNDEVVTNSEFIPHGSQSSLAPARPDDVLPDTLQLVPLASRPYFPVLVQPVVVASDPYGEGLKRIADTAHRLIGMSYAPVAPGELPGPGDVSAIGVVARIHRLHEVKDHVQFIAQGIRRFRITEWV
ncbi:MAG: LON peptidase substrate-binding domain-containing protein, partial [Pseudomonadales bacterium]|nr:LON peptidase substrate-binding domain-containing protein [Pseudomonadales bacterium]